MIEVYTSEYKTMGYHSDLAIDLVEGSSICIYSCYPNYSNNSDKKQRKLMIKDKITKEIVEMPLLDGHCVVFNTDTNRKYLHKIVGDCDWLGITFRLSKTYAKDLRLANDDEKKEFFRLRGIENKETDFKWGGNINYTINPGDLMEHVGLAQEHSSHT